jgi:hypothetical protein
MNKSTLKPLIVVLCLAGCQAERTENFIPGTYIRSFTQEFSVAADTLFIAGSGNKMYAITRKTGYKRIENGKTGNKQYKTAHWVARFDPETNFLYELQHGKVITLYPDSGYIRVMNSLYRKIN